MEKRIQFVCSCGSTNSAVAAQVDEMADCEAVVAYEQTAGRGQRGNSWESRPGDNLTLSVLLRPEGVEIAKAFPLSEAVALAVVRVLDRLMPDLGEVIAVKWPNDIYVGDRKIAGILIENSLSGRLIGRSIAGIGVNVNQQEFLSDAPNPVSVRNLTGREYAVPLVASLLLGSLDEMLRMMREEPDALHSLYMSRLWRGRGSHMFLDVVSGERFEAAVESVAPSGFITLRETGGDRRTYAFKEIQWV